VVVEPAPVFDGHGSLPRTVMLKKSV
jgi:hypothetical protein